ncbi:MAG: metallophosphoesterase family protein [Acidimicrobiia bacterium]
MRFAILSDIHGNPVALEAVLSDIEEKGGADSFLVLGDLVSHGYDPVTVLERLTKLSDAHFVRGNADRWTLTGDWGGPRITVAKAQVDPALVSLVAEVARAFGWTHGYLSATGWIDWLKGLPLEQRIALPDGTRLLGVHAAPGRDDGADITPELPDEELAELIEGCEADLVCVGNSHWPSDRTVGDVRVLSVGSVSNPLPWLTDKRPSYALLEADSSGYQLELHRAFLNVDRLIDAIRQSHVPNAGWLINLYSDSENIITTS